MKPIYSVAAIPIAIAAVFWYSERSDQTARKEAVYVDARASAVAAPVTRAQATARIQSVLSSRSNPDLEGLLVYANDYPPDAHEAQSTYIKDKARAVVEVHREFRVTSEWRPEADSKAHARGAVDISSKDYQDRHREAQLISSELGPDYTVVVEEMHRIDKSRGEVGPEAQIHTAYRDGQPGNVRVLNLPTRADGATHTHIQPDNPYTEVTPAPRERTTPSDHADSYRDAPEGDRGGTYEGTNIDSIERTNRTS